MASSSNLNDQCCICLKNLVKGQEYKQETYKDLNDNNVKIIERFANAWKEQGSPCYDKCIKVCQKYKEQKCESSFHVQCYKELLSNATYLEECKKKSQVEEKDVTSAGVPSNTSSSLQTSPITSSKSDNDYLSEAAAIIRKRCLKLPNGIFNDYSDDPLVYTFFSTLCTGDETDIPSKNEELNKKILLLCQEFATAVHKHKNQESSMTVEEDSIYLSHLVMKTVRSCDDSLNPNRQFS